MLPLIALLVAGQPHGLHFEGDGQIAVVPYQKAMDVPEMTLELWFKMEDSAKERHFNYLISRNYEDLGYGLAIHGKQDKVFSQAPTVKAPFGTWTHLAIARSNKAQKIYVNGELVFALEKTEFLKPYEHPLLIGNSHFTGEPGGKPTPFRGTIDEVRLWSKPRTQAQIRSTMKRYLKGNENNLVAYFPMEEGKDQYIHDYSGHLLSGSLGDSYQPNGNDPKWSEGVPLSGAKPKMRKRRG